MAGLWYVFGVAILAKLVGLFAQPLLPRRRADPRSELKRGYAEDISRRAMKIARRS